MTGDGFGDGPNSRWDRHPYGDGGGGSAMTGANGGGFGSGGGASGGGHGNSAVPFGDGDGVVCDGVWGMVPGENHGQGTGPVPATGPVLHETPQTLSDTTTNIIL